MLAPIKCHPMKSTAAWHAGFLAMVPVIRQYAMGAFGHLNPEARQDLVQETICNAMLAYLRLFQRGRIALAYPTVLAKYGIAQVKDGRRVGAKLNVQDVSSAYCQRHKKITMERLDHFDEEENQWAEAVVQDTRTAPVPDIVAFRCDFRQWLKSLPRRNRRIAQFLALGNRTGESARKFQLSEGRISQVRRELQRHWQDFIGEGSTQVQDVIPA